MTFLKSKKGYELNGELETISNVVYSFPTIIYLEEPSDLIKTSNLILSLKSLLEVFQSKAIETGIILLIVDIRNKL